MDNTSNDPLLRAQAEFLSLDIETLCNTYTRTIRLSEALKEMVESLGQVQSVSEILPKALRIVTKAVGAETSAYFELPEKRLARLRFWLLGDRALSGQELIDHPIYGNHEAPKLLAEGFEVPENYFKVAVELRTTASPIDHREGTLKPIFDDWLLRNGWPLELNVPILMRGRGAGVFCLLRRADNPFTGDDIALSEALSRQLALMHEAARIGELERDNAIAKFEQQLAHRKVEELERRNDSLTRANSRLSLQFNSDFGRKATETIEQLLAEGKAHEVTVRELSSKAGYSIGHYNSLFRNATGQSPAKYIIERKLHRAKLLLIDGRPATWVANECGFCDHAHLSRRFKESFGIRPSEVRRMAKMDVE